jgi:2-dehydro-3-deoxyglucarate aldolase/4-hydroxy-2-oxoheptanedioate aldolase
MKTLKTILQKQPLAVGLTTMHVVEPWLAKLFGRSGADFVYVEYEHGFFNEADLAGFVLCCRAEGLPVVAKVPECSRTHVAKLLECGVTGIQLPWTETREQIDRLASYVKYPPAGIRAACPGMGNCDYDLTVDGAEFLAAGNRETVILAHVETRTGVQNITDILGNPHVDVAFLGMYDLSVSYGHPGDFRHPEVAAAVEQVIAAAHKAGKTMGMWVPDYSAAAPWIEKGVTFFETGNEVDFIDSASRRTISEFRSGTAARQKSA